MLSLVISISLPYTVLAFSESTFEASVIPLGNDAVAIRYEPSIGYYLIQEISQGLEFTIIGEGDFDLVVDVETGNYYLVEGVPQQDSFSDNKLRSVPQSIMPMTSGGTFQAPTGNISTTSGDRTITGHWWGGLIAIGGANVDNVGSATIARTANSESRASVTTGLGGGGSRTSVWTARDIRASASSLTGISGNRANWDLRSTT